MRILICLKQVPDTTEVKLTDPSGPKGCCGRPCPGARTKPC